MFKHKTHCVCLRHLLNTIQNTIQTNTLNTIQNTCCFQKNIKNTSFINTLNTIQQQFKHNINDNSNQTHHVFFLNNTHGVFVNKTKPLFYKHKTHSTYQFNNNSNTHIKRNSTHKHIIFCFKHITCLTKQCVFLCKQRIHI